MSRSTLPGRKSHHTIDVGLDRRLQEWFFILYDKGNPVKSHATRRGSEIISLMWKYADPNDARVKKVYNAIMVDQDPGDV